MRIVHHHPKFLQHWRRPPGIAERMPAARAEYDRTDPAIYICGIDYVDDILREHGEIRFVASLDRKLDGPDKAAILTALPPGAVHVHGLMDDRDPRAAEFADDVPPNVDNMGPVMDFLREWKAAAPDGGLPPSMLVHCQAGRFRSTATAIAAHTLWSGDPDGSVAAFVRASPDPDANWEMARIFDDFMGLGGTLRRAVVRMAPDWEREKYGKPYLEGGPRAERPPGRA